MTQEETKELDIVEYAELVNGRVAGLRLAFTLYMTNTQSTEDIKTYVKALEDAENIIETGLKNGAYQFNSKGYPDGTLDMLRNLIESLNSSLETMAEIEDVIQQS